MNENLSYFELIGKATLKSHASVLNLIKENLKKALKLENDFAIFLDTNVLLRTYSVSFKARKKLLKFYENKKENIFLTNQVQLEFIKNREDVINQFFDNVTNKIPNDFRSEVISQIGAYLDRNKVIFKDYEGFESELNKIKISCEMLHNNLVKQVEVQKKENSDLIFEDLQISIFQQANCLEPFSEEEIKKCKDEYNKLTKNIDREKISSYMNKSGKVFPGLGDLKEKPEDPYGDYIIFHEMMKFSKENKRDIVFLTYDNTKGDWMRKDKKSHLHYVDNFYLNTGQLIFILDAERIFEDLLDISFKSLIQIKEKDTTTTILLTLDSLNELINNRYPDNKQETKLESLNDLYLELIENGYNTIDKITFDLNRTDDAYIEMIKVKESGVNRFNQIGNIRLRLELCNKDYRFIDAKTKQFNKNSRSYVQPFEHLVK